MIPSLDLMGLKDNSAIGVDGAAESDTGRCRVAHTPPDQGSVSLLDLGEDRGGSSIGTDSPPLTSQDFPIGPPKRELKLGPADLKTKKDWFRHIHQ